MGATTAINTARQAAGAAEPSVEFSRPVEEARTTHESIGASSAASQLATERLGDALGQVISGHGSHAARALLIVDFIDQVRKLSYSENRMIVGLINECRNDKTGAMLPQLFTDKDTVLGGLSQAVPHAIAILEHVYRAQYNERNERAVVPLGHDGVDAALNEKFAEHTMMLLRAAHPLGVNIRNPSWRSAEGSSSYPAEKLVGLQLGGEYGVDSAPRRELGSLVIKPKDDTSVVKFIPFGCRWVDVAESATIRNGESVIVGRPLAIPQKLFGIELPGPVEVPVGVKIPSENLAWSRGSLFIHRSEDGKSLYILDRGTKCPIVSPDELGAVQTFIPRTVMDMGSVSFGHSIAERPRKPGQ